MKPYLFLLSVGPVQSFISQARKTHDLYAGSKLLSALCQSAMNTLPDDWKVIFPHYEKNNAELLSIPNRFIAKGSVDASTDLANLGKKIEAAVQDAWQKIAEKAIKDNNLIGKTPKCIENQLKEHLDIHWLFYPILNEDYHGAYKAIEKKMAAIKNVRTFTQLSESGRKCSLDGERNVKFYRLSDTESMSDFKKVYTKLHTNNQGVYIDNNKGAMNIPLGKLSPGEGLSAVSFVKRCYTPVSNSEFPSTAEIALMHTFTAMENLADAAQKEKWTELKSEWDKAVKRMNGNNEWQLYYEENLTKHYIEKNGFSLPENLSELQNQRAALDAFAKENGAGFSKYYALIIFDGDNMGRWLSGENEGKEQHIPQEKMEAFHKDFAKTLNEYGIKAETKILIPPFGKTVYAGGDDFLGFINLAHLWDKLTELRTTFDEVVNKGIQSFITGESSSSISFSAGIAIAHYKMPLSEVLHYARELEKKAKNKNKSEKNAFALGVMKHSGNKEECVFTWGNEATMKGIAKALEKDFTSTFIKQLYREFSGAETVTQCKPVMLSEIRRLIARACEISASSQTEKTEKAIQIARLVENTEALLTASGNEPIQFLSALNICEFIQRNQ